MATSDTESITREIMEKQAETIGRIKAVIAGDSSDQRKVELISEILNQR